MAKKARTPPPPRRVQAPKTRKAERDRRSLWLILAAALALAALGGAAAGAYLLLRDDGGGENAAAAIRSAGCTYRTFPALEGAHVAQAEGVLKEWNSFPPSSGPHFGQWAVWGLYDEPVSLTQATHNLEHGGVVMWYGSDVPPSTVAQLRSFYLEDPVGVLVSPLPRLGDKLALTAWNAPPEGSGGRGILVECTTFDEDAFTSFRDEYRFKAPERFPPEQLQPGT